MKEETLEKAKMEEATNFLAWYLQTNFEADSLRGYLQFWNGIGKVTLDHLYRLYLNRTAEDPYYRDYDKIDHYDSKPDEFSRH